MSSRGIPTAPGATCHAPELRERLKDRVKGVWCATTVATVCGWAESCRRHLDLVLLDLGGRHAPGNEQILRHCSHALVVARRFADREVGAGVPSATPTILSRSVS
jgi:hypothetical protein